MSTHIVGIKPPDERWKAMKAVWDACRAAKVDPPAAVQQFFGGEVPDPSGVIVELVDYNDDPIVDGVSEYRANGSKGFEVDVTKLPKNIKIIRFWNGW